MKTIRLRHGKSYLQVQSAGVQLTATTADVRETYFTIRPVDASLARGARISLRAHTGLYLQAVGGGGSEVVAVGPWIREWETFLIEKWDGAKPLHANEPVLLRTHTGHYLSLVGNTLSAHATAPQAAALFDLEPVTQLRPLNMVVIGDSVVWGQGLKEEDKFDTQVEAWLEAQLGRKVHRYRFAHSGATVQEDPGEPPCYDGDDAPLFPGEIPRSNPGIWTQAEIAGRRLELWHGIPVDEVDFVLMNGGINTVGLTTLLNPLSGNQVTEKTRAAGGQLRQTVTDVLGLFPRAKVVLTNYFPLISSATDLTALHALLLLFFPAMTPLSPIARQALSLQSKAFHAEMTRQMHAIAETNPGRVVVAESGFTGEEAFGAPKSLLWNVGFRVGSRAALAVDDVAAERARVMAEHGNTPLYGFAASAGHPNRDGARCYAQAINRAITPWLAGWKGALITVDTPRAGATVLKSVTVAGWALDGNASVGTGISKVHLYLDGPPGTGTFLGAATCGVSRPDVAAHFGEPRFADAGWHFTWETTRTGDGPHSLWVCAFSTASQSWQLLHLKDLKVAQVPYPDEPTVMVTDPHVPKPSPVREPPASPKERTPVPDDEVVLPEDRIPAVRGMVRLRGWAADRRALTGTGIDKVHLYLDGPAGQGRFLGEAVQGGSGPDRAPILGSNQFRNCEWHFDWNSRLTRLGTHRLYVYAHSTVSNTWDSDWLDLRVTESDFAGDPLIMVDQPAKGVTVKGTVMLAGWSLDRNAPTGTGVDQLHVYLDGEAGTGHFLGAATYGLSRPDVGAHFGEDRFTPSGWQLAWNTDEARPGNHTLHVYAHSTARPGWCLHATHPVRIESRPKPPPTEPPLEERPNKEQRPRQRELG